MNNKSADQTAQMRRLICAFVVRIGQNRFFHDEAHIQTTKRQISLRIWIYSLIRIFFSQSIDSLISVDAVPKISRLLLAFLAEQAGLSLTWSHIFLDGDVPRSTSYGVYVSQLIRFARVSSHVADFNARNTSLTAKLLQRGYRCHKLQKTLSKFYRRHYELVS